MIEVTNLVTLSDDNEYVVTAKAIYNGKVYYYFVDINNNKNIKFLYEDGDELVEEEDDNIIRQLLPLFLENIKEMVPGDVIEETKNMITPEMISSIEEQIKEEQ